MKHAVILALELLPGLLGIYDLGRFALRDWGQAWGELLGGLAFAWVIPPVMKYFLGYWPLDPCQHMLAFHFIAPVALTWWLAKDLGKFTKHER